MKKLLFYSLLLLTVHLSAQEVTVSEEVLVRENRSYHMLDDQRGNVLLFHDRDTKFEVEGYDERLHKQWEKEIELDKKQPEIVDVTSIGGDFCVIYTFRQKQKMVLKAHRYNPGANLIDSVTIKNLGGFFFKPTMETTYSEDNKVALIWSIENQNEINAVAFHMGRMKLLWERKFIIEDFLFSRDFQQIMVNNDGHMFFILKKENRRSRQSEHYIELFECSGGEDTPIRRFTVGMQNRLTFDVFFTFDNLNKSIVAGGMYSEDHTAKTEGLFYLNISHLNTNDQVLIFHPFEEDFVKVLLEKDKSKSSLSDVKVQEVVLRRDGGILLICEMAKDFSRGGASTAYYARSGVRPIIDYYYDDIFLFSIHPDGKMHWKNILHKKQYSQDDGAVYSSYFLAKTPSSLRIIFNDEIKQDNTVSEYVIRGNGEYDRNAVMNTERKDLSIRFQDGIQVSSDTFVAPSERRHRVKLVKVKYE